MAFPYDLMQGAGQPSTAGMGRPYGLDVSDVSPMEGYSPGVPQGTVNQAQPQTAPHSWITALRDFAQQQQTGDNMPAPTLQPAVRPSGAAQPLKSPPAASQKGLGGNSRKGFDMQSLMALASLWFGGAGLLGGAGAAGGAAAGGEAAGGGAMGGMNPMSMMQGLGGGGGGGGGQQPSGPQMSYAPLPAQTGPLVPQSTAYWKVPQMDMPWMFTG